ncbi:MAG: cation:proton antiporter [Ilumatobacteraceae bacterium]|nr:cation:proton antiporter [Ilumatobacteraceae bacterium]
MAAHYGRMHMTFGNLALLVAAGLIGPALSSLHRVSPPAVVGEIGAGLLIGVTGFHWIDPSTATMDTFSNIGFAMLMFLVGTHVPLRDPAIRPALAKGALVAATVGALSAVGGVALQGLTGLHRPAVLAVLIATSSAAVALPILQSTGRNDTPILVATTWIAIADVSTVLALPLVLATGAVVRVVEGGAIVVLGAVVVWLVARAAVHVDGVHRLREQSRARGWALDLRISILVLFVFAWLATRFGTSILIAGFATGTVVAAVGEPRRVAQQLIGLGEGFFVPIFFVILGARLDLGSLGREPRALAIGGAVLAASVVARVVAARLWRVPLGAALLAAAQLGVPSAIVSIGLRNGQLRAAQGAAIMAAAVVSLGVCALGARLLGRTAPIADHAAPTPT